MNNILDYPYDWNKILRKSVEIKEFLLKESKELIYNSEESSIECYRFSLEFYRYCLDFSRTFNRFL